MNPYSMNMMMRPPNNPMNPINVYHPFSQQQFSQYQSNNISLFHIPSDATNSLYIDGVPNDTNER